MTGFARVSRSLASGELTLSVKAVNHRGLDLHVHVPTELDAAEPAIRSAIRKRVSRGHVQIQASFRRTSAGGAATVNESLLAAWLAAFNDVAAKHGLDSRPDLNQALRMPGMMEFRADAAGAPDLNLEAAALEATDEAVTQLNAFRDREGAAIEQEIRSRAAAIRSLVTLMEDIRSRALPLFHNRLKDKLSELLNGVSVDPARLAQEAAILAERSDIAEELVRLRTHSDEVDQLLSSEGETGKKLDFLLQEMNRESNTILSKTGGLGDTGLTLTNLGLAAKAEIDRIREQSLNIE